MILRDIVAKRSALEKLPDTFTPYRLSKLLKCERMTISKWLKKGMPAHWDGKKYIVHRVDFIQWFESLNRIV